MDELKTAGPPDSMSAEEAWSAGWRRYSRFRWWAWPFWNMGRMLMCFAQKWGLVITWRRKA